MKKQVWPKGSIASTAPPSPLCSPSRVILKLLLKSSARSGSRSRDLRCRVRRGTQGRNTQQQQQQQQQQDQGHDIEKKETSLFDNQARTLVDALNQNGKAL